MYPYLLPLHFPDLSQVVMAKASVEDMELRRACAAAIASAGAKEEVVFSIRVAKGRGIFEKLGRLAKPRVIALTCMPLSFNLYFTFTSHTKSLAFSRPTDMYRKKVTK